MTNDEIGMASQARIPNAQIGATALELDSSFDFRHSSFDTQVSRIHVTCRTRLGPPTYNPVHAPVHPIFRPPVRAPRGEPPPGDGPEAKRRRPPLGRDRGPQLSPAAR